MKKRKLLILLLVFLMLFSFSFGTVAFAYSLKYEKEEGENYIKDSVAAQAIKDWSKIGFKESQLESGPFYMLPGAAVSAMEENVLTFTIFCKDKDFTEFTQKGRSKEITITLLRQSENNQKYTESSTYQITYSKLLDNLYVRNLQDELYGGSNAFAPVLSLETDSFEELKDFGFKKVDAEKAQAYGWTEGDYFLRLVWKVDSAFQDYRVMFDYTEYWTEEKVKKVLGVKVGTEKVQKSKSYTLLSDVRSYYQVLDNINKAGKIEDEFFIHMYDYVYSVLGATEQTFTIEYLENIDKTPFAKKVQTQITLTALQNTLELSASDVATALGKTNVNVLLSACKGFYRDTTDDIFKARYYDSVYLNAKTVDGKSMAYILDPNLSYYDFYNKMDKDDIITSDMMSYCFNETLKAYPELSGYSMQEVYGYFGYIVLPDTFTVNQAYAEIFGNELEFDGVVNMVAFKDTITVESYNKLLKDYNYPWLSVLWNTVAGAFTQCNATHVMLYADCSKTKAYENLNGSPEIDNGNGLLINKAPELIVGIVDDIQNTSENLINTIFNRGSTGISLGVIIIIVLAGIIIIKWLTK